MSNCLGIFIENNVIKYAKLNTDKNGTSLRLAAYGVRFGDNTKELVDQIIKETNSVEDAIATNIVGEEYESIEVFSKLNKKDIKELIISEYDGICMQKGVLPSMTEMKFKLVKNIGDSDKYKAICVSTDKVEMTNIFNMFSNYKLNSISPLGTSIVNILPNKGIGEEVAVVNIEDETTVTIIERGEISDIISFPIGMKDVLPKLSEKYNSYSKAYEACKEVSAYIEDIYALDESNKDILDLLVPTLYDLRARVEKFLQPHLPLLSKIYLTGTGIIINNLDLYFQEIFSDKVCQILVPYFLNKDSNNLKDIVEVNTAIALAFNGIGFGYNDKYVDFVTGASANVAQSEMMKKKVEKLKDEAQDLWLQFLKGKKGAAKSKERKIEFNDEVIDSDDIDTQPMVEFGENTEAEEEEDGSSFTPTDWWLLRATGVAFLVLCIYSGSAWYTQKEINAKQKQIDENKSQVNSWISKASADVKSINEQSARYVTMRDNLQEMMDKVTTRDVSFDVPNFLSRLMFIMPENVQVTSIDIADDGTVQMSAESGQYAQLGYFVSRLKLDEVLANVDMQVESMSSNIKIKVSGELP